MVEIPPTILEQPIFVGGFADVKVVIEDESDGSLSSCRRIVAAAHELKLSYQPQTMPRVRFMEQ